MNGKGTPSDGEGDAVVEMLYSDGGYGPLAEGRLQVEDRGFLFGDGVYEVVKVLGGTPLWVEDHLRRLDYSLEQVRIEVDRERHPLGEVVRRLVRDSGVSSGIVYLQITRGVSPRDFSFPTDAEPTVIGLARPFPFPGEDRIRRGVSLYPLEDIRWARCDIKSTNLLPAVMAKNEARDAGYDEALWLSPDGTVREGASSNLFAVVDGILRTHPANNRILNGITRLHVLRLARSAGVAVEEEAFGFEELKRAEEVFIASTTNDVMPAVRVGEDLVGTGRPGRITLALADALRAEAASLAGIPAPPALA